MEGTILDSRYEVIRELGRGGMGAVYEARHSGTGRRVAVKVITADLLKAPGLVARFEVEARAAGRIESQHIAQVLDSGRNEAGDGAPYIVMEYLSGEDLYQVLSRLGPLPPDLALRIVAQACLGLDKAHRSRIIHRDVKPANIYLNEHDDEVVVKLLDFGIAKIKAEEGQSIAEALTRTGNLLGSPLYMSPEQARGNKAIDKRSDVWSLGVVLYEALVGRTPHHDIDALGSLIIAICSEPPVPVQERAPWVPGPVAAIVHKALAIRPEDRFQSADEMYKAIRALLPGGHGLEKSMFVPLTSEERAQHAEPMAPLALASSNPDPSSSQPGLDRSSAPAAGRASNPALATSAPGEVAPPGEMRAFGPSEPPLERPSGPEMRVRTTAGVTSERNASATTPRSKLPLAIGGGIAAVVVAVVALRATGVSVELTDAPKTPAQAASVQAVATQVASPPPAVAVDAGVVSPAVAPADTASAVPADTAKVKAAGLAGPNAGRLGGKATGPKAGPGATPTKNVDGRIIRTDLP